MRRIPARSTVGLAVLGVLTVVLLVLAVQKQATVAGSVASAVPSQIPRTPMPVAFVGDGWTSGSPAGGRGSANYTAQLASRNVWAVTNVAVYGSGYVAGPPLAAQMARIVASDPRLVVVSGGRADLDVDPAAVQNAAGRLFEDLRTRLPRSAVVVIGPTWLGDDPPRRITDIRDAVRDAAAAAKLPFVDPIADLWFISRDRDGVSINGDLNDRGHGRLTELVDASLRRTSTLPR